MNPNQPPADGFGNPQIPHGHQPLPAGIEHPPQGHQNVLYGHQHPPQGNQYPPQGSPYSIQGIGFNPQGSHIPLHGPQHFQQGNSDPTQHAPTTANEFPAWLQTLLLQQTALQQQFFQQQQQQQAAHQTQVTRLLQALSTNTNDNRGSTGSNQSPSTTPQKLKPLSIPKLQSPENLSIPQFRDWKQRWDDYAQVQQLDQYPIATQQGILRSALDPEWTMLWSSNRIQIHTGLDAAAIVILMESYLRERRNPLLDRQEFHRRDQAPGESIDRYYSALKTLDEACAHEEDIRCLTCPSQSLCTGICTDENCKARLHLYPHLQETRIRDRLICGLMDKEMRTKILAEQYSSSLSLEKVLAICTAMEHSKSADAALRSPNQTTEVHATSKPSSYKSQKNAPTSLQSNLGSSTPSSSSSRQAQWLKSLLPPNTCFRCGMSPTHPKSQCSAIDATCTYKHCKKVGHVIDVCGTRLRHEAETKDTTQPSKPPVMHQVLFNVNQCKLSLLPIASTFGKLTFTISYLPDTGAELDAIGILSLQVLPADVISQLSPEKIDAVGSNGISLGPVGTIKITLVHNDRRYTSIFGVYQHLSKPLLSKAGCIALGLIGKDWPFTHPTLEAQAISSAVQPIIQMPTPADLGVNLIKQSIALEYAEAFDDSTLRPMNGPPMSIELVEGAIPFKRYRHNNIPYYWRDQVKQQLDDMVAKGIIEAVPVGEAIDWCHPMVVVPKKETNEPRITIDLTKLNQFVRRPAYPTRVPREAVARIPPGQRYFTTLDARHGYWQVPLDEKSRKLTTFITPWGCFRYLRNVMGLISAGDEHNRRGDEALAGIPNVEKIVEDVLIYDTELEAHIIRVKEVIQRCMEHGISLNLKKFHFAQPSAQWCGYILNESGYSPAPHLVDALRKFPVPTSKTDVRSFSGLVQQFESFSYKISELATPLRALLPANASFTWTTAHQQSFEAIIEELTSPRVLAQFNPGQPLRLETDAAQSKGLGYALWQQDVDNTWRLLRVGSRFLTPTESRYSATEIELLAVVWAVKKCRLFLLGNPFEVIVDHRALICILNSKTLDEIENSRLLRLKEKLSMYRFTATWRPGTKHTVVDVLSRHPVSPANIDESVDLDCDPKKIFALSLHDEETSARMIPDSSIQAVRDVAKACPTYRKLITLVHEGFPEKSKLEEDIRPYWGIHSELTVLDGLVFWGSRIIIPKKLRRHILQLLHASHQGHDRTLRRARQAVFWPGITNDIKNIVNSCQKCQHYQPSLPREPLLQDPPPQFPFQEVGVDLFSYAGKEYLVMVDRFSGWISVCNGGSTFSSATVIQVLKQFMTDTGIPEILRSDNGPQFSSFEFKEWTRQWGITHKTSSPHYPQSNGLAESAVKAVKYLLAKTTSNGDTSCDAFRLGLLELRNTPRADGQSPAQLLFGHPTRSLLPLHRSRFSDSWRTARQLCEKKAETLRERATTKYNERAQTLKPFQIGDIVLIQDHGTKRWDLAAEILEAVNRRSYLLRTEAGRVLRRNRRFLRHYSFPSEAPAAATEVAPPPTLRRSPRHHATTRDPGSRLKGGVGTVRRISPRTRIDQQPRNEEGSAV